MRKSTIIFDFDGTVGDTMPFIYKVSNELARHYKFDTVTQEEFNALKDKSPFEIVHELHIPILKIPFILHDGRTRLRKYMKEAPYVKGMRTVLYTLRERGYTLGMLTSNSRENIDIFIKRHQLHVFDFIFTENNLFGKQFSLLNILHSKKLDKAKTVYVGDEVRDIEACQVLNLDIIAVTWGFSSKKILEKYQPTYLIDSPSELTDFFKG